MVVNGQVVDWHQSVSIDPLPGTFPQGLYMSFVTGGYQPGILQNMVALHVYATYDIVTRNSNTRQFVGPWTFAGVGPVTLVKFEPFWNYNSVYRNNMQIKRCNSIAQNVDDNYWNPGPL